MKFFSAILIGLILWIGLSAPSSAAAAGIEASSGAAIFEIHCAGCHINGGNIVRRNKTLKLKALQKNKMDSIEAISQIVANGKGNMSAYTDRLSEPEIQTVAAYVMQQAEANWKPPS